jgi:1,4-alpha-glucan branching enzyme
MQNGAVTLALNLEAEEVKLDSLLQEHQLKIVSLDTLRKGTLLESRWRVVAIDQKELKLTKALNDLKGAAPLQRDLLYSLASPAEAVQQRYNFGYNQFSEQSVFELENGNTLFLLRVRGTPESVYLSGSFNDWSTLEDPMRRTDSGYVALVNLKPGAHYYKFIVNGHWLKDPLNRVSVTDYEGNINSVYFKTNYLFKADTFKTARQVQVAGTFNGWESKTLPLKKRKDGWERSVYLPEGTHAYKLVVDGTWCLDPSNPLQREDGAGNLNSFLAIGDTFYFELNGHQQAQEVFVTGNFNDWNERELAMEKTEEGWRLAYVLGPGNYEYKFIVDGQWQVDPINPYSVSEGQFENSLLSIAANQVFVLSGYQEAESVSVSGDFNQWAEPGYKMRRSGQAWLIDLYIPPGKTRYKFLIDGREWVLDPANELWEENEFGTGNSVLWK